MTGTRLYSLHPICDVRAQRRRHHGSSWHVSSQHGTRHAVRGTDGSHSRVRRVASGNRSELTCRRRRCALARSATKAHARCTRFARSRFFEIVRWSVVGFFKFILFVCLSPGYIGGLWRVVPYFCHWPTLAIRVGVGLRVRSLCLRLYVVRGSRFLSLIYTGDSGWVVCSVALFAT